MNASSFKQRWKNPQGFSTIELMVAMIIGSIIIYGLYRTYIFQDQVMGREGGKIDAVQNARNTVDILTRDLRIVGSGVPDSVSDKITAANYQSITYLANFWNTSTKLSSRAVAGDTSIAVEDSTGFYSGQQIYICSDENASSAITLNADPPNGTTIALPSALGSNYATGCTVNVIDTVTYSFSGAPKEINRTLLPANTMNTGTAETLAENIDYVQFKFYNSSGTEVSSVGSTLSQSERQSVRKIKLLVVAIPETQHNPTSTVTYDDGSSKTDGYVRMYLESDIRLRNMTDS